MPTMSHVEAAFCRSDAVRALPVEQAILTLSVGGVLVRFVLRKQQ